MPLPAYVYARFSTKEQDKGDSLDRQLREGKAYVAAKGWDWSADRQLTDKGRSAYHGANRLEGSSLHSFERRAEAGDFKSGVVLAVENLDRLTRQGYESATDLVRRLTGLGVTVACWHDNQVYEGDRRIEFDQALMLIVKAELAHVESENKSKRLRSAWAKKISDARNGDRRALTKIMPGWLVRNAAGLPEREPHRTAVLNEIFDLYIAGRGLPQIVRILNERGEPNWGLGRHGGKGWNVSTLHKYLTSRAVLGEYERRGRAEESGRKIARGFVIPDFYPQAVTAEKFNRVQAIRKQRTRIGGKNLVEMPNLFRGMATCFHCGGPMRLNGQTKAGVTRTWEENGRRRSYTEKGDRSYLRCDRAIRGYGCDNKRGVRYQTLEVGVLDALFALAMRDEQLPVSSRAAQLRAEIAERVRLLDIRRGELSNVVDNLTQFVSRPLAEKAAQLEKEIDVGKDDVRLLERQLTVELGNRPPEQDFEQLIASRVDLQADDPDVRYAARAKAHQALRFLVTRMACDREGGTEVVICDNGFRLLFNQKGECEGGAPGQGAVLTGPHGEIDWHPDHPDAEYEIAPGA